MEKEAGTAEELLRLKPASFLTAVLKRLWHMEKFSVWESCYFLKNMIE